MKIRKINKKAIVGEFPITFVATILVVLILVLFIFGSIIYKKATGISSGTAIYNIFSDLGIKDYMDSFQRFTQVKLLLNQGNSIDDAKKGAGYDEK